MSESIKTGVDVIRGALKNRAKHGHLGTLARDLGVGIGALEDFAYGHGDLPPEKLQLLAKDLFPEAEYDPELNLMRSAQKNGPSPSAADILQGYEPKTPAQKVFSDAMKKMRELETSKQPAPVQPPVAGKPQPKRGRPGWLGGFF